ncbi:MAG: hypothetical protein II938_00470 [Alphaproteobacteria bacterium]|nr:hypothetical protein [Alphaproteobacteria bacterium]
MQNKFLYQILCAGFLTLVAAPAVAQESDDSLVPTDEETVVEQELPELFTEPKAASLNEVTPDLTGKQAVDFPSRTSLDSIELTPLPGIYETNINGPVPLAPSVSAKDMPSERLLGRLTPEVFQEMAELERDNTFLKLQIQKETMKNDLEKLRANYRQARLDEIAKREDVVRTRIQWWQEQEKIRQDLEAQRVAVENLKNEKEEKKAEEVVLSKNQTVLEDDIPAEIEQKVDQAESKKEEQKGPNYALISIFGINNVLNAKIRNVDTGRWANIQVGDTLIDGSKVKDITPTAVILTKQNKDISLTFDDMQ